ncbi:MAG: beta-galactosidase trimerization domain-containing protein, partial [Terriglobia bacterium]
MNRRNFMGSMVAGVTAAQILKMPLPLDRSTLTPIPRVQWLKNGLIYGAGSHETYLFLVRRGSPPLNLRQAYDWKQSEMFIRQLKDLGAELFYTHLYKGFGMAAAMPEMEQTKRAAAIAHGYGMRVGTYIQWDTMMYETFFAEEPRAEHWIQRDPNGLPIGLTYGYQQSFRYRPCFTHQEYVDYLKTKIVRYAVEEVKTDYIFFDNFDLNPEPDSCHCPVCVKGFRVFLKTKYTPEKRRERFGFENVDYVNPPLWNRQNPPERMEIIQDPAFQEWVDFRCQVMADALRQMAEYAKSLNAEVAIAINCHAISGENRPWTWGTDHRRLFTSTDLFATDDRIKAEYLPDGRLATEIRSYKVARAFNNVLLTSHPEEVEVAEGLAFNQSFGSIDETVGTDMGGVMSTKPHPISPMLAKYLAFYRKNRDLYVGAKDVATVGSLRSYASITYHQWTAQMSALLVEQTLIQARIPFHLIFDEPLPDFSKLKVLILPGSECLSEEQIGKIRAFVKGGGGLVATGATGLYDEWYRPRVEP